MANLATNQIQSNGINCGQIDDFNMPSIPFASKSANFFSNEFLQYFEPKNSNNGLTDFFLKPLLITVL